MGCVAKTAQKFSNNFRFPQAHNSPNNSGTHHLIATRERGHVQIYRAHNAEYRQHTQSTEHTTQVAHTFRQWQTEHKTQHIGNKHIHAEHGDTISGK